MAHRENSEDPGATIDGVNDAESPHAVPPESLQFPLEAVPQGGIATESLEGTLDRSLQLRRQMPQDLRHMEGNVEAIGRH